MGCGMILGEYKVGKPEDSHPGDAGTSQYVSNISGLQFATAACGKCTDQSCEQEETDCALDPDCKAWAKCRAACGNDPKCIAGCPQKVSRVAGYPISTVGDRPPSANAYGICLEQRCSTACLAKNNGVDIPLSPVCSDCCLSALAEPPDSSFADLARCESANPKCFDVCALGTEPDWSCVGSVYWGNPPPEVGATVTVIAQDGVTKKPIAGATVKACIWDGTTCEPPLDTGKTDSKGSCTFHFGDRRAPDGLFDYWTLEEPSYVQTMNWMTPPPVRTVTDTRTIFPVTVGDISPAGTSPKDKGTIAIFQQSCSGPHGAAGVALDVTSSNAPGDPVQYVYTIGGSPAPGAQKTDGTGVAIAKNVLPGPVVVRTKIADPSDSTKVVAVSEVNALVRPGWMTLFSLPPTPITPGG
jgi:hypothetical protein